jgi:hypothetical protein
MKLTYTIILASMVLIATSAYAGTYSLALPISKITFGSTGNLYIYPAQETTFKRSIDHGGGVVTDYPSVQHIVPNPAGCSDTSRIVMKSDHPLYEHLVGRIHAGYGLFGVNFAKFYISSSECTVGSPTMLRIRESFYGLNELVCNSDLEYQYETDSNPNTSYSCRVDEVKW